MAEFWEGVLGPLAVTPDRSRPERRRDRTYGIIIEPVQTGRYGVSMCSDLLQMTRTRQPRICQKPTKRKVTTTKMTVKSGEYDKDDNAATRYALPICARTPRPKRRLPDSLGI